MFEKNAIINLKRDYGNSYLLYDHKGPQTNFSHYTNAHEDILRPLFVIYTSCIEDKEWNDLANILCTFYIDLPRHFGCDYQNKCFSNIATLSKEQIENIKWLFGSNLTFLILSTLFCSIVFSNCMEWTLYAWMEVFCHRRSL